MTSSPISLIASSIGGDWFLCGVRKGARFSYSDFHDTMEKLGYGKFVPPETSLDVYLRRAMKSHASSLFDSKKPKERYEWRFIREAAPYTWTFGLERVTVDDTSSYAPFDHDFIAKGVLMHIDPDADPEMRHQGGDWDRVRELRTLFLAMLGEASSHLVYQTFQGIAPSMGGFPGFSKGKGVWWVPSASETRLAEVQDAVSPFAKLSAYKVDAKSAGDDIGEDASGALMERIDDVFVKLTDVSERTRPDTLDRWIGLLDSVQEDAEKIDRLLGTYRRQLDEKLDDAREAVKKARRERLGLKVATSSDVAA